MHLLQWGKGRGSEGKKRDGNRPRHALGHGRIYNQSNNEGCWTNIHLLPMVPMESIAFAVRTRPEHGGSAGALREKKRVGNRPRDALGHGRIYNQSNNVGCWANIHLLPMVTIENIAFAGERGQCMGEAQVLWGQRPRDALGHGPIYNQSNNVGCWANIRLLPMVPPCNEE